MDDPISALDAQIRKKIIENLILKKLSNKTRILVTHAIDFVHLADRIIIMDKGKIHAQGSYEQLKSNQEFSNIIELCNISKSKFIQENFQEGQSEESMKLMENLK